MFTLIIYKIGLDISKITDAKVSVNTRKNLSQTNEGTVILLKDNEASNSYFVGNCEGLGEGFASN